MQAEHISQLIQESLPEAQIQVLGEEGAHFTATIICDSFCNQSRVERHRRVMAPLSTCLQDGLLHAFSMTVYTRYEWEHQCNN